MKINFKSKSIMAKIALVLVIVLLFQFSVPKTVQAAGLGGQLLNPIVNMVVFLADGVISILQSSLTNVGESFQEIQIKENKTGWIAAIVSVIVGALCVVGGIIAIVKTAGAGSRLGTTIISFGLNVMGKAGTYIATYEQVGKGIDASLFGTYLIVPNIYISPETILKNQIQIFNVDYINEIDVPSNTGTGINIKTRSISYKYWTISIKIF